jgi:hypothetical protein
LTLLNNEIPIPFGAFGAHLAAAEDIDVLADEIDGTIITAEPVPSAVMVAAPPLHTGFGRVVIAVAGGEAESLAAAHEIVDRLLGPLAERAGLATGMAQGGHDHHDPADLDHWAQVDAARGRLATELGIVVCTHHLGLSRRTYVVTLEAPARLLGVLVPAVEAIPTATRMALLTAQGPTTTEPAGSVVTLAAAMHAHRVGGRAEVFPGQQWLTEDLPVSDVLRRTAIDEIRSTQGPFAPGAVLRAYGFVRPSYDQGALVLTVGHDDPLIVTPWEVRYCRPCCGIDH